MARREMILLAVMGVAIVVGGYLHFFGGVQATTGNDPVVAEAARLQKKVEEYTTQVQAARPGDTDLYRLARAQQPWAQGLFMEGAKAAVLEAAPVQEDVVVPKFVYSGYITVGGSRMAIINGLEYRAGEMVADTRYVLQRVGDSSVVLATADGSGEPLVVSIVDPFGAIDNEVRVQ